ncbi:hypothetical protein B0H34DRAFT_655556, partial [Crassisporium funariophilum]
AALVFLLWDTLITWKDEVHYIWPQSIRSPTKWVFLFTRYFGILAQARLVSVNMSLTLGTFSTDICRMIYISQVICGGVLMACVQSLLMLRVYALYIQDRRVAYAMIALLVAELGSMPGVIHMTIPNDIGQMCMKPITIRDIALFGVSAVLPQLLVLGLTIVKFLSGLRAGWGKIPIVSRLVRDDVILVSVIGEWETDEIVFCLFHDHELKLYSFYFLSRLLDTNSKSQGCRVVINMQKLAGQTSRRHQTDSLTQQSSSAPQLTTCIFDVLSLDIPIPMPTQTNPHATGMTITNLNPIQHVFRDSHRHSPLEIVHFEARTIKVM